MKKLITILAILVLAAAAIFATSESHTIKITVNLAATTPAFQLVYGDAVTNTGKATFGTKPSYTADNNEAGYATGITDFTTSKSVSVTARIANAAQIQKTYTLSFGDGVFTVVRGGSNETEHAPTISVAASNNQLPTGIDSITIDDEEAAVEFNGAQCTANTNLVTATYTYGADTTIAPGTYSADITMTVSTT